MSGAIISVKFNYFFIKAKKCSLRDSGPGNMLVKAGTLLSSLNKLQVKHDQAPNYHHEFS